jgi:hypothetical protein
MGAPLYAAPSHAVEPPIPNPGPAGVSPGGPLGVDVRCSAGAGDGYRSVGRTAET